MRLDVIADESNLRTCLFQLAYARHLISDLEMKGNCYLLSEHQNPINTVNRNQKTIDIHSNCFPDNLDIGRISPMGCSVRLQ